MDSPKNNLLLDVKSLQCTYQRSSKEEITALSDLSFSLPYGRNLGVIGQSGSGKSSLIKSLAKLIPSESQHIIFDNHRIDHLTEPQFKPFRKEMQLIFQDPHSSFNPYLKLKKSLLEPLYAFPDSIPKEEWLTNIEYLLHEVGLHSSVMDQYPKELSGGMIQRASIARSLLLKPKLILADEPVSALDFIIQAHIIDLLERLQVRHNMSYLIISHSLSIIKQLCQDTLILYQGRMSEYGATTDLLKDAIHPYTQALVMATENPLRPALLSKCHQLFHWQGQQFSFYVNTKYRHYQQIQISNNHWLGLYSS